MRDASSDPGDFTDVIELDPVALLDQQRGERYRAEAELLLEHGVPANVLIPWALSFNDFSSFAGAMSASREDGESDSVWLLRILANAQPDSYTSPPSYSVATVIVEGSDFATGSLVEWVGAMTGHPIPLLSELLLSGSNDAADDPFGHEPFMTSLRAVVAQISDPETRIEPYRTLRLRVWATLSPSVSAHPDFRTLRNSTVS